METHGKCSAIALMRGLYADKQATGMTDDRVNRLVPHWQGCPLSPQLFNLYAEYIIREAGGLEEDDEEFRIGG